uniref:Afadin n=1 Tax=Phallusia mammillata TaxID=59560 RepID=A0A6F9DUD2_9ASCI|nr:afadin [Phallusia mammillata]
MDKTHKKLAASIKIWNESRLDLFRITKINEKNEFSGIVRFYHQDTSNNAKYATKCVRVSSSATTVDVITVLAEKFRSDMRMLTTPYYGLYEVHMDGESRKLGDHEYPLLVQLNWIKDDREGRFLLRHEENFKPVNLDSKGLYDESEDTVKGFKLTRNLTKKEKKNQKKREKAQPKVSADTGNSGTTQTVSAAKQLYNQVPESTFTRTVSNPEAVMKKRREQKLQKRGAKVLKIYGDTLNPEIPYKTLLLLPTDTTTTVIRDALNKYGFGHANTAGYQLIQVVLPPGSKPEECFEGGWGKETTLDDKDLPLVIFEKWQPHQGTLIFQLRKHILPQSKMSVDTAYDNSHIQSANFSNSGKNVQKIKPIEEQEVLPMFLELIKNQIVQHFITTNVSEVGKLNCTKKIQPVLWSTEDPLDTFCIITNMDGVVTITPHEASGQICVNRNSIDETKVLDHDDIVQIGKRILLFCKPAFRYSERDVYTKLNKFISFASNVASAYQQKGTDNVTLESTYSKPLSPIEKVPNKAEAKNLNTGPTDFNPRPQLLTKTVSSPSNHMKKIPSCITKLPVSLLLRNETMEQFFNRVLETHGHNLHFKLSTAYTIYLAARWLHEEYPDHTTVFVNMVTRKVNRIIQGCTSSVTELAFWMANISEILNFLRQDKDLHMTTNSAQDGFAKIVQICFRHIVQCMQKTLFSLMPAFLSRSDEDLPGNVGNVNMRKHKQNLEEPVMNDIRHMLSSAMSLLRKCRVNAALTIQLFSQLFHFINMWLFNKLVSSDTESRYLCSKKWGMFIRARLAMIEAWAEKQGLELAADCHLARITQATHLLQAPKYLSDDIAAISGTCFKLNSLQLQALLTNYTAEENENVVSSEMIEKVVSVAENSADELTRSDGRNIQLMEDPDLQLPFLLPEDGYSCDVVHGAPSGLVDFLQSFSEQGLCSFVLESDSNGSWTEYFTTHDLKLNRLSVQSDTPSPNLEGADILVVPIKKINGGMGLSIVAAKGVGSSSLGIYIRSVVKGGAAEMDGRIQAGDQLISVDGYSLIGVDQEKAAQLMTQTGHTAVLEVAKQGAIYHGLAMILNHSPPKQQHLSNEEQSCMQKDPSRTVLPAKSPQVPDSTFKDSGVEKNNLPTKNKSQIGTNIFYKSQNASQERTKIHSTRLPPKFKQSRTQSLIDVGNMAIDNPNYSSVEMLPQAEVTKASSKNIVQDDSEQTCEKHPQQLKVEIQKEPNNVKSTVNNVDKNCLTQKMDVKKFSTLPRYFKSSISQDRVRREKQEKTVQDELNALREEEIHELTDRLQQLSPLEKDRLKTLIQEREFHNKVQNEKLKILSDEDVPVEDFSDIPDRPDRDRFIQHEVTSPLTKNYSQSSQKMEAQAKSTDHKAQDLRLDKKSGTGNVSTSPLWSPTLKKPATSNSVVKGHEEGKNKQNKVNVAFGGPLCDSVPQRRVSNTRIRSGQQLKNSNKYPRPVSDGIFLSSMLQDDLGGFSANLTNQTVSYVTSKSNSGVIGSQELYNDPYQRKQDIRGTSNKQKEYDPSSLTFKDRQRMFQGGGVSPVTKPKSSKTLLKIEKKLGMEYP